jgi:hypothetical protein
MVKNANSFWADFVIVSIEKLMDQKAIRDIRGFERKVEEDLGGEFRAIGIESDGIFKVLKSRRARFDASESVAEAQKRQSNGKIKRIIEIDDTTTPFPADKNPLDCAMHLVGFLPFLNPEIYSPFLEGMKENFDAGISDYAFLLLHGMRESEVWDKKGLREWERDPAVLGLWKKIISMWIDGLTDPKVWEEKGLDEIREEAEKLKRIISKRLDILAI